MEPLIIALALLGQPATCELPTVCEPTTVEVNCADFHRRRPAVRALRAVGRGLNHLRPFRRDRRCR